VLYLDLYTDSISH